jgi:hypothetical protein
MAYRSLDIDDRIGAPKADRGGQTRLLRVSVHNKSRVPGTEN